ncbi:Phenolphthiocerol/phthiocerol polyketide synthase subunit C ((Phenol)carboxyphthiodiolenone synthase subunit D) (Beta-ketoacyl-acyl-carrier-protein synthase I) (Phthiocerol synthesis polyketide synthase type I PpsD) [Durusdinium trenchii]|uniref:Ketosynthase family 3 (KS3) domain-containing protein n=1 Tax=Durusdinium trenchii TaxID=1381693 RepID=A0ABP0QJW6_9DINO
MDVDAGTPLGTLVLLTAKEKLTPIGEEEAFDFNGTQAQLVENGGELGMLVLSFSGYFLQVPSTACRLLAADELQGYDLVLGPTSSAEGLAKQMPDLLLEKGYVTTHMMLPARTRAGILATVKQLNDYFVRLPTEFELGYLGRGSSRDRVAMLESLESAAASSLLAQEQSVAEHLRLTRLGLLETFGFRLSSRTTLLLRLSGGAASEEPEPAEPPSAAEAEAFLALMGRKRLCLLRFLGPGGGTLRLIPRKDEAEVTMDVCINMQVVFLTQQYDYQFDSEGECLVLQSFFLEEPLQLVFQKAEGRFSSALTTPVTKTPKGQQVLVKGMASRDPCEADLHEKLWAAVRHGGCDGFLEIPKTRFDIDQYVDYEDQQRAMSSFKSYCRHQGHIEGIEIFDASFFNIMEQEVRGMDPEQRIFMETGWMALADAGYKREQVRIDSAHLGVFVGISGSDWRDVCRAPSANGVPETFIANRFSYVINLKGPSFIVNTACSASLVALHNAKTHLLMPQDPLDGCLVAGISLNVSPGTWIGNCAGAMLSFRGRCFSFNATADGYGRGEGCAAAVIERGKYNRDDDTTCGSLAASHTNSDGRSASLTAPNGPAQQRLLRAVLGEARLQSTQLDIYEAHGTGTSLGDPIEISAVRKVLTQREHPVMVSCSKPNLGHLEGGAGMSAFCKCVLACMHAEAAGNQHLRVQNPNMDIEGWPAFLLQEAAPLKSDGSYVGVSGFGYGGTNSHALAFGHNVVTSRGDNKKRSEQAMLQQVRLATPEINMVGENYEDWQTSGLPHLSMKPGASFEVEVMQGRTHWHEVVPIKPRGVSAMSIMGSFNNWMPETMMARERPGLFSYELTLGQEEETFQVLVDGLLSQVLHPLEAKCSSRCSHVVGPRDVNNRELAWLVKGKPRTTFRVEVFIPPGEAKCMSVTWFKAGVAKPPAPPAPAPLPAAPVEELSIEE